MFAQNNKVTENEPRAVRRWRKNKFSFRFDCKVWFSEKYKSKLANKL